MRVSRLFIAVFLLLLAAPSAFAVDCYTILTQLRWQRFASEKLGDKTPVILKADGTTVPIAHAFEKEGLFYSEIAKWFPSAKPAAVAKVRQRLNDELSGKVTPRNLSRWLKNYAAKYRPKKTEMPAGKYRTPTQLAAMTPEQLLEHILSEPDFFRMISVKGREDLFFDGVLNFDDLAITEATPARLTVGDDLGSYEVRSNGGTADRTKFYDDRAKVETELESKVGHQHKVHAWPVDPAARQLMAPYYIELLDSGTWYLYWRQMNRDPRFVESILSHPFLGVYTRPALERLEAAVLSGDGSQFKNKYRMIGARNFKIDPKIPEQAAIATKEQIKNGETPSIPDFELRSGNKTDNRDFVEDMIEARIASGDYSGLRDFHEYRFDPSAPMEVLVYQFASRDEIVALQKFELAFPLLKYSANSLSHNHYRTKFIAPLLPWDARLKLSTKREKLLNEQKLYAKRMARIAGEYLAERKDIKDPTELSELNANTLEALEKSAYKFAKSVRLDLDFERYLTPQPLELPTIQVKNSGPIDVNEIPLGIENSFRFPTEIEITSKEIAEREIRLIVLAMRDAMGGGKIEKLENSSAHGHSASIRYRYTDPYGRVWRAEWDGIQRSYFRGNLVDPHGGHIEVPSPKYVPRDARVDVAPLYKAARQNAQLPKRTAGGGHVNTDLSQIKALGNEGVQKVKSIIGWWESNREMATFLWQHPKRAHAARPVELKPGFAERLAALEGDWYDLARFLYNERYFNVYEKRKPRYVEWNLTSLMTPAVPMEYRKGTLDIKNPEQEWFPDFGAGNDRAECRFYDAPTNEYFASLQIKYHRAMLDAMLNAKTPVPLKPLYAEGIRDAWRADPVRFVLDAEAHLRSLGLEIEEFRPLINEAWYMHQTLPSVKELKSYEPKLLPPAPRPAADPVKKKMGVLFWSSELRYAA